MADWLNHSRYPAGLLVLFLHWFARVAWNRWNGLRTENPLALAATLAIAIALVHSLVDYPLRTAAVSGLIALCCVIARREPDPRGALSADNSGAGRREVLLSRLCRAQVRPSG